MLSFSFARSATLKSTTGAKLSISSIATRFFGECGWKSTNFSVEVPGPSSSVPKWVKNYIHIKYAPENWYNAWFPNSEAQNKNSVLITHSEIVGGIVSKYRILISLTVSWL